MSNFIESVNITNYKRFSNLNSGRGVKFAKPNGIAGSGLNVLVGRNNSGKSTVISLLTKLKPESKIYTTEKRNNSRTTELTIVSENGTTTLRALRDSSRIDVVSKKIGVEELEIIKETRVWPSNFSNEGGFSHQQYVVSADVNRLNIDGSLARRLANIKTEQSDTEQNLNKLMRKLIPGFTNWDIVSYNQRAGDAIGYKTSTGAIVEVDSALGSGMLNLFRIATSLVSDFEIILIDEPEAFLHPQAQLKLVELLIAKSSAKQIIYTTHSPYMLEQVFQSDANVLMFQGGRATAVKYRTSKNILTSNYIAWKAFETNRFELHNELFSEAYIKSQCTSIAQLNTWLGGKSGFQKANHSSDSTKDNYGNPKWPTSETFPVWIRNYYNHPELNLKGAKAQSLGYHRLKPTNSDIDFSIANLMKVI
jgi:predicted ATP-dependent endonuclease of OLD family